MHPSIQQAYDTGNHPLKRHPIHGIYGKELAHDQYEYIKKRYQEATGSEQLNMQEMMRLMQAAMQKEAPHRDKLKEIAKQIVAKVWKADPNIFGEAELGSSGGVVSDEPEGEEELTPDQVKEVQKRVTLNTLTHGAAIHQMTSMHHMAKEALNKIDPQLVAIYDKLSRGAVYSSWFASIEQIMALAGQKGGESQVTWDDDEPKIQATALVFPMLIHELSKGMMELLTSHGLPQDPELLKKIYKSADRYNTEVFHFFVGPALWRKFIKIVDQDKLAEVIAALSRQSPDHLHKIISAVVDSPEEAAGMINDLIEEPDEFDVGEYAEEVQQIADMITDDPDIMEDFPEAPAAEPEVEPAVEPVEPDETPSKPDKPSPDKPSPFKPPKPAIAPRPKARGR